MYSEDIMTLKPSDIETNLWKMTSGTSLIQRIVVDKFRKRLTGNMIASDTRLKYPGDEIKYHPVFKWGGKELAIENTDMLRKEPFRKPPEVIFGGQLAMEMEWVCKRKEMDW